MSNARDNRFVSDGDSTGPLTRRPGAADIDQRQIDRLVDGELNEAERGELLLALDRHPDGWRRCALAFLEAQCWREALRAVRDTAHAAGSPRPPAAAAPGFAAESKARRRLVRAAAALAMAASLAAASMLGAVWQQWRSGEGSIARQDLPGCAATPAASTVEKPQFGEDFPPPSQLAAADDPYRWHTVTIALHDDSNVPARSVQLPAREHDHFEEALLEELPAAIPPDVWESLERVGCRVVQQRQLMPLPLGDGRMLVVPVDSVELRYVGRQQY